MGLTQVARRRAESCRAAAAAARDRPRDDHDPLLLILDEPSQPRRDAPSCSLA